MSRERWRVYIGNLAYEADADDLARLACTWGNVLGAEIVRDATTGRSKGFGWVDMTCKTEARAVAEGLSGREFRGRRLTAHFLNPPEPSGRPYSPTRFRADWAPSGSDPGGSEKRLGRAELQDLCREFGRVLLVEVDDQSSPGPGQGCACVEMDSTAAARAAIAGLDGREYGAYRLTARPLEPWEDLRILGWYRRGAKAVQTGDHTGDRGASPPDLRFSPMDDFDPQKVGPGLLAKPFEAKAIEAGDHQSRQCPDRPGNDSCDGEALGSNRDPAGDVNRILD
jgi:hypothetical protein